MERKTLILIILSILVGLIPMVSWGQGNNETRKLKIAIPVREFKEFVDIQYNPQTNETKYRGFAIDVFYEVHNNTLATPFPFEFVPFQKPDGTMNGSFDDMLQAVFNKTYDGAVGEITILDHRTEWVDFTMPYIGSPITMLVRVIKEQPTSSNTSGISLIKITYAFLITTYALSFIATTIYVVGISKSSKCARLFGGNDNNNPKDARLGALIHTRVLMTTLLVIIVILLASYIVSQASTTVGPQHGRPGSPSIKSLTQLIREDANVGYREGSFVANLLSIKGFQKSKLISLKSDQEMMEMLSKGTSKGGVDAIVANELHLKLLRAKFCDNNFTIVPIPFLHAAGIGFAFEKGSDKVKEVSKGIMKLADGGQLQEIENRTLWKLKPCANDDTNYYDLDVASSSLPRDYIWILIVGGLLIGLLTIVSFLFLF